MVIDLLRVHVENGKYTLVQNNEGKTFALRYGEHWQDLVGNKFVLTMGYELDATREVLKEILDYLGKEDKMPIPPELEKKARAALSRGENMEY